MAKARAHVFLSGLVQGVFFRSYTKEKAMTLFITGWVRNSWDGRVEAVFEGKKEDIDKMTNWCYHGPPMARVDNVEINWETYNGEFESFIVIY
ncbi:MAG: acylphosphatase [Candidatus Omnitrophota bacterium]|nr:acylphosphatase [Candidatus Omnitrophota bacterium]